jgi:hypothetical protein
LVAAEEELGPLFSLVERAGEGQLTFAEMVVLFWHCMPAEASVSRDQLGSAMLASGLAECSRPLRSLLSQILQGKSHAS